MNLKDILLKILAIADFPNNKREEFIKTFYDYLFTKLVTELGGVDPSSAQKLASAAQNFETDPQQAEKVWREFNQDPQLKEKIDQVLNEVIGELVDDIAKSATDAQKQQILASLPG